MRKKSLTPGIAAAVGVTIVVAVVVVGVNVRNRKMHTQTQPAAATPPEGDRKAEEVPPLYPFVRWQPPRVERFEVTDDSPDSPGEVEGTVIVSDPIAIEDLTGKPDIYFDFYRPWLEARGWKEYIEADSPGAHAVGWKREGRYFIIEDYAHSTIEGYTDNHIPIRKFHTETYTLRYN